MEPQLNFTGAEPALERARSLIEVHRFADAVPLLRQALVADPQSLDAHCMLAISLHVTGQSREGLKIAGDAVLLDPEAEWAHRVRALILTGLGRHKEALAAATQCAALSPDDPRSLECLARAQHACRQKKEAAATAAQLVALAPEWDSTHELLGDIALDNKRWKEAEHYYRNALRLDPSSYSAQNNLGVALQRLNRNKEATECFHQASKLNPVEKTSRDNLYSAVKGYAGVSFVTFWVLLQVIRVFAASIRGLPESQQTLATIGFVIVVGGAVGTAYWFWRKRMNELHPTVTAFYRDEQRRTNVGAASRISALVILILAVLACTSWTAVLFTEGPVHAGLTSWPLALYLLLIGGTVYGARYTWNLLRSK
jgi:tetratricopeptide (TPR) repeat protein